jgi:hypothetical protein
MAPQPKTPRFPEQNAAGHVTACVASRAKLPRAGAPPSSPIFVYPKHADATPSPQGRVALQSLCLPFPTAACVFAPTSHRGGKSKKCTFRRDASLPAPAPAPIRAAKSPQLPRAINAVVGPLFWLLSSCFQAPPPSCAVALPCLLFLSLLRCRTSNTERSVQLRGSVHRAAVRSSLSAARGVPAWDPEIREAPSPLSGGSRDFFRRNLLRNKELPRHD